MRFSILFLVFIFSCTTIKKAPDTYAVKCGNLFDSKNGIWQKDQTLLIENGIITQVNPILPEGMEVHDYKDFWIIPGLIDSHSHVFLDDPTMGKDFSKGLLEYVVTVSDEKRLELGKKRLLSLQRSGFTSVRDLGNQGRIKINGVKENGARFFSSGAGFTPRHGQFPVGTQPSIIEKEYRLIGDYPENFSGDVLKIYADEEPNTFVTDSRVLKSWTTMAHQKGLKVAAHAIFTHSISSAIDAKVDSIEHGNEITIQQLNAMKKNEIIFVPTYASSLLSDNASAFESKRICRNIRDAVGANVSIAYGSDNYISPASSGMTFGEATLKILLKYPDCGMAPIEALRAATWTAALSMGKEKSVGYLGQGSFADFIVLSVDPSEDLNVLTNPAAIYTNGKIIRLR